MKEEIENIIKKHQSNFGEIEYFDLLIDELHEYMKLTSKEKYLKKIKDKKSDTMNWIDERIKNRNL
jgi:hypothetical protein